MASALGLATSADIPLYTTSSLRAASVAAEVLGPEAGRVARLARDMAAAPANVSKMLWEGIPGADGRTKRSTDKPLAGREREIRYVLFDARGGRVYGACYDVGEEGPVEVIPPPRRHDH